MDAYPENDGTFPLLVIFDDSLHNRWSAVPEGVLPEYDASVDIGRLRTSQRVPCGQSIHANFTQADKPLVLRASQPVVISNATAPLQLALAFTLPATQLAQLPCTASPGAGAATAPRAVSIRMQTTVQR